MTTNKNEKATKTGSSAVPLISVIIPIYNAQDTLALCLDRIYQSTYPNFEVILVDDCSTDASRGIAGKYPAKLVSMPRNMGAAPARNKGAREAEGSILLFMDSDILVEPESLALVEEDLQDKEIAGVIGLLSPKLKFSNFSSNYKNLYMHYTYNILPRRVSVFYTSFAAVRKEIFAECGGFDDNYRQATIEDIEVGERITSRGYKLIIDKRLQVEHVRHYYFTDLLKTGFRRAAGISKIMLRKKFSTEEKSGYQTSPFSFRAGIGISFLIILSLFGWLVRGGSGYLVGAFVLYLILFLLNLDFLLYLKQTKGFKFYLQSSVTIVLDMFSHGLGVIYGLISFFVGERY
jgi:glycosyltransferase involved in cell wall biosynthesis